jgi:PRC-barrel domain
MAHYGRLATYQFPDRAEDIRGATLYGLNDDKLGKIDDVIFNHSTGNVTYLVVDTGGWLNTKKFLVPADRIPASSNNEGDFVCDLDKQQIETFPPYDEKDLDSEERWTDYEGKYRAKWETSPVMHREGTDRNVTPTTQQLQGNPSSIRASQGKPRSVPERRDLDPESVSAASVSTGRVVPAGTDTVVIENSVVGIGGRWDTFQARLRERRKEAIAGCRSCTVGSPSAKGSESAETLKKAV